MSTDTLDDSALRSVRATATRNGLEAALRELHQHIGAPEAAIGHGGRALLPEDLVPGLGPGVETGPPRPTDTGALVLAAADTAAGPQAPGWCRGVAWIRIGAAERLTKSASRHLARRKVQGRPTLGLQMVRGNLGDIATALAEAACLLEACGTETARFAPRIERDIELALRLGLKLFGAAGYVVDAPSNLALTAHLLGELYGLEHLELT